MHFAIAKVEKEVTKVFCVGIPFSFQIGRACIQSSTTSSEARYLAERAMKSNESKGEVWPEKGLEMFWTGTALPNPILGGLQYLTLPPLPSLINFLAGCSSLSAKSPFVSQPTMTATSTLKSSGNSQRIYLVCVLSNRQYEASG